MEPTRDEPRKKNRSQDEPQMQTEPKSPQPAQKLEHTGEEVQMKQRPKYRAPRYKAAGKLEGKVAIITGGDSGIGRAVAVIYAREGADVCINYFSHDVDAEETKRAVEAEGRRCMLMKGDVSDPDFCRRLADDTVKQLGGLDILVNNAAHQVSNENIESLPDDQIERTFRVNILGYIYLVKACLKHMGPGSAIVASGSETGIFGSPRLLDYSATKGALHMFTKSLAGQLVERGIRANVVAPGPVWTPLNPADPGVDAEKAAQFGSNTQYGRPAQPEEIAPAYVFLASDADSSYITGQVISQLGGSTK